MNTGSRDEQLMLVNIARIAKALESISLHLGTMADLLKAETDRLDADMEMLRGENAQDDVARLKPLPDPPERLA